MATVRHPVEVDVTYVNKTWFRLKKKINGNAKYFVIGFYQRDGKAILKALSNNNPETIEEAVFENVERGCILYCEENILPESLDDIYEIYELKSSEGERVCGDIHINNVNNMWKDLKRQLKRTHIQVSQQHLQGYLNEVVWRVNTRHLTNTERFELALSNYVIKPGTERLNYSNLTNRKASITVGAKETTGDDLME